MLAPIIVDLRSEGSWDLARLTAESFRWPVDYPLRSLDELASTIYPASTPSEGAWVITPGGLDARTGGVRRRSDRHLGSVYQVGESGKGLRPGDLLIPPRAEMPVLYVSEALLGSLVSSAFMALRPVENSLWMWGVLNSKEGKQLRTFASTSANGIPGKRAQLLELQIPWAPLAIVHDLHPVLRALEEASHGDEEEAPTSWWRLANLATTEWRLALATPRPELLEKGFPLSELVEATRRGVSDVRHPLAEHPRPDDLPVLDASWLRNGKIRRWSSPESTRATIRTGDADVVMAAYGTSPHAMIAPAGYVVDTSVYALTLREPSLAPGLVRYLNSRTGQSMRRMRLSGTMQKLNLGDVRKLQVTERVYEPGDGMYGGPLPPLEERLESALWA